MDGIMLAQWAVPSMKTVVSVADSAFLYTPNQCHGSMLPFTNRMRVPAGWLPP